MVRRPQIAIDVRQGEAYALSVEEAGEYNPHIAQTVPQRCPILSLRWLATSVELLSTIDLMCRATNPSARVVYQLPHDT